MNYYSEIGINRERFSKEYLEKIYESLKSRIKKEYVTFEKDSKKIEKLREFERKIDEAYTILSNDELREKHNQELDNPSKKEEKRKKEFITTFDKDHLLDYKNSIIEHIGYKITKNEPFEYFDRENGRRIFVEEIGEIDFKTRFGIRYDDLRRYKVTVKNILDDDIRTYKIITSFSRLKYLSDKDYKDYFGKVLLSDENLKTARKYNGGYVGEIREKDNSLTIEHDQDCLCAAIEFSRRLLTVVNQKEFQNRRNEEKNEKSR